uniref:Uncharacterized protein n=1 Tax=Arundo donax TaxID=35708 RepID=A0A0A9E5Z7_ARUDO
MLSCWGNATFRLHNAVVIATFINKSNTAACCENPNKGYMIRLDTQASHPGK